MKKKKCALFVCVSMGLVVLALTGAVWAADKELDTEKIAVSKSDDSASKLPAGSNFQVGDYERDKQKGQDCI